MTLYFSGNETTERESLADTIAVRTPMATPMISRLPSKTISNRVHEWSLDEPFQSSENVRSIGSPHANTRFEGDDYNYRTPFYPTRLKAICEIQHFGMEITDTDRTVVMAGTDNTFDYRAGQLFTKTLNSIDNTLLYGVGSPETSGATGVSTNQRQVQGLVHWAAWTGLERVHGTNTVDMMDPYGTTIPASMWSVFYDFQHTNITGESFYSNIVRRITNAGGDMESAPWQFWCGDLMMARVSKFLLTDGGVPIHDRSTDAASGVGYDHLHTVRLPNGYMVSFRTNRWLDDMSNTFTVDPSGAAYTPGSPNPAGTVTSRTFSGDQTMIGFKPGSVKVCWLRAPGFEKVETNGDYSRLVCKSEFTLEVAHPLDVAGCGNALS